MTRRLGGLLLALALAGCSGGTSSMPAEMRQRIEASGIVRREDDARIRYTRGIVRRQWDEGVASIVLTREGFLIHKRDRVLFEITPLNRGRYRVHRDHDRAADLAGQLVMAAARRRCRGLGARRAGDAAGQGRRGRRRGSRYDRGVIGRGPGAAPGLEARTGRLLPARSAHGPAARTLGYAHRRTTAPDPGRPSL